MAGIKEVKEVLAFVEELGVKVAGAASDGLDLSDVQVLMDAGLWAKAQAAFGGIEQVGAELKDLDIAEIAELASAAIMAVGAIVAAAKPAELPPAA